MVVLLFGRLDCGHLEHEEHGLAAEYSAHAPVVSHLLHQEQPPAGGSVIRATAARRHPAAVVNDRHGQHFQPQLTDDTAATAAVGMEYDVGHQLAGQQLSGVGGVIWESPP
jgi:hypothetical protein